MLEAFFWRSRRMPTVITSIQHHTRDPRREREKKNGAPGKWNIKNNPKEWTNYSNFIYWSDINIIFVHKYQLHF